MIENNNKQIQCGYKNNNYNKITIITIMIMIEHNLGFGFA
jgi:hypothetical protein